MKFTEWMQRKILKFLGLERLYENPKGARLTFINSDKDIKIQEIRCGKIWYLGDSNQLLNYYTERRISFADNPIFNRNIENYFWAKSTEETDIKRIHSGVPHAIIDTLSNILDMPEISEKSGVWEKIAEENDFKGKLTQQSRPLTLAEGFGAWKVNINKDISKYPLLEFYEAENCEYIVKSGMIIGIVYKSYYKNKKNQDFVLLETRYRAKGNSYTEYQLCKVNNDKDIEPCAFSEIEELAYLDNPEESHKVIEGLDMILGVPSRYFYDVLDPEHGRSIFSGKYDLFDMLDEILSQASQTNRVSTPIEYYSDEVVFRDKNGNPGAPRLYNRQFMQKEGVPDGDGNKSSDIITTQPDLNFDKYGSLAADIRDYIFSGVISPATMGIDVAKKDNADAQREKEKVSLMTRNNIINAEQRMIKQIVQICLYLYEYMETSRITLKPSDISVKYNEFANPAFENMLQVYGQAWVNGEISTKKYVEMLWGDKMTETEQAEEAQWLDENRARDDVDINSLLGGGPHVAQGTESVVPGAGEAGTEPQDVE